MNRLIEVHGGRRLIIPVGLPELMHDIGKEVIKHQPENLLTFIAEYLEKRVEDLRSRDPLRKDLSDYSELEQSLLKETSIILNECGIDLHTAVKAATTIQATFRGFLVRKRLKQEASIDDRDKNDSDDKTLPTDNGENLEDFQDTENLNMMSKGMEEKSSSTSGSALFVLPEVDFKASKQSIDQGSYYEQVSLFDYDDYDRNVVDSSKEGSYSHSMISTNTITREMAQTSNTYLDFTQIQEELKDPFKEYVKPAEDAISITSDLEIFKHIDLESYEESKDTNEHYNGNKGFEGGSFIDADEVSGSPNISGSTQKSDDGAESVAERHSVEN